MALRTINLVETTDNEFWEREPFVGYAEKKPRPCPRCGDTLMLRHSKVYRGHVWLSYKCPTCHRFLRFVVSWVMNDPVEYVKKILDAREGKPLFVPLEDWHENQKIKQSLKALGYW